MTTELRSSVPQVLLHLPSTSGRDTLRAGLMALQCVPVNLPHDAPERYASLQRAASDERVFLFIDISNSMSTLSDRFDVLVRTLPLVLRPRTILTRLAAGHVSEADRQWVKELGFVDLIAEFDARDPDGRLHAALDMVAMKLGLAPPPSAEMARFVRALTVTSGQPSSRALLRARTELSAEKLAELMSRGLDIQDRSYHLKKYPACFVASEAVAWMVQRLGLTAETAVAVGQALGALGLLYHVEHQHGFSDDRLFFRVAVSRSTDPAPLGHALRTLFDHVAISDRTYLGKVYPDCWVGAQAVDVMCAKYKVARHRGHRIVQRLMQFGLLEHVANEQPFIDGFFFYRFRSPLPLDAGHFNARGPLC